MIERTVLDGTLLQQASAGWVDTTRPQPVHPSSFVQVVCFGISRLKSESLCSSLAWKVKSGGLCL